MAERKLPQNIEAEMAVLGCAFLTDYAKDKVCEELSVDMFLVEANKRIFEAIYELFQKKAPLDSATVTNEISKKVSINSIGGIEYLSEVVDSVISAANVDHYISIVKDKALRRALINVTNDINVEAYDEERETSEVIDAAEQKLLKVTKQREVGEFKSIADVLNTAHEHLEKLSQNKGDLTGVRSGFTDLDQVTNGFQENTLVIIASRPSVGKSTLALNMAVNAAMQIDKAVAIFSLEMGAEQIASKIIASTGGIDLNTLNRGDLKNTDWKKVNEAMSQLAETDIYIDDTSGLTVQDIRAKCRRLYVKERGLGLVIVDYLQLIQSTVKYQGQRQNEVAEISRMLKLMAMELKVPVIALSQMSRDVEQRTDKRPVLSDLRESGAIEQDADIVAFLHNEKKEEDETTPNLSIIELIIRKHRAGSCKTIELVFEKNLSSFRNFKKGQEEK